MWMMTAEYRPLLTGGVRTASLDTVRAYCAPHVVHIWFDRDGGALFLPLRPNSGHGGLTAGDLDLLYWATRLGDAKWARGRQKSMAGATRWMASFW